MALLKTISRGRKNQLLNSDFSISQRTGGFSTSVTGTLYLADRWRNVAGSTSGATHSLSTLPGGFPGDSRISSASRIFGTTTGAGAVVVHQQRVESVRAREMDTDIISVGFWVYASNFQEIRVIILTPDSGADDYTTNTVISDTLTPIQENTWEFVSVENINLVDRKDGYLVDITFTNPNNAAGAFDTYITQSMCNEGSVVEAWSMAEGTADKEFLACLRYYETSYELGDAVGTSASAGALEQRFNVSADRVTIPYRIPKAKPFPTITTYNPDAGGTSGTWRDLNALTNRPTSIIGNSNNEFAIISVSGFGADALIRGHWASDSELG